MLAYSACMRFSFPDIDTALTAENAASHHRDDMVPVFQYGILGSKHHMSGPCGGFWGIVSSRPRVPVRIGLDMRLPNNYQRLLDQNHICGHVRITLADDSGIPRTRLAKVIFWGTQDLRESQSQQSKTVCQ